MVGTGQRAPYSAKNDEAMKVHQGAAQQNASVSGGGHMLLDLLFAAIQPSLGFGIFWQYQCWNHVQKKNSPGHGKFLETIISLVQAMSGKIPCIWKVFGNVLIRSHDRMLL